MNSTTATTSRPPFLRSVSDAIDTLGGGELAAHVSRLHESELDLVRSEVHAARDAAAQTASSASLQFHLLAGTTEMLQHTLTRRGELAARVAHLGGILDDVTRLARESEASGGMVPVERLRGALSAVMPPAPWQAVTLAFAPSQAYRVGYFTTDDEAVVRSFAFVGWAMHESDRAKVPRPQAAFLMDGRVMAHGALTAEYGLVLKHLE